MYGKYSDQEVLFNKLTSFLLQSTTLPPLNCTLN